ncbi:MAG: hypothetical protein K0R00_1735 [Herbinix sp.]|jgi:fructokinase|nr:hypothetical protein [Herbinix sp.]
MLLGALEAGGTKMVLAIGDESGNIEEQIEIPTVTPEITTKRIIEYFKNKSIKALGIGSFGPIDLNRTSKTYGYITSTPKLAWVNYDLVGVLQKELDIPIGFDTDVNASALGEVTFGCMKGLNSGLYLTIGTGVGAGVFINGSLLHGMLHPEAGHVLINRHKEDSFEGICPYHNTCLEGLASGPAIEKRWGHKAVELSENDKVWEMEAFYIAQALMGYILTLSPEKIVLGGGVMHQLQLFPLIRNQVKHLLNGYLNTPEINNLKDYIVPASLADKQGIMGCLELARLELKLV